MEKKKSQKAQQKSRQRMIPRKKYKQPTDKLNDTQIQ